MKVITVWLLVLKIKFHHQKHLVLYIGKPLAQTFQNCLTQLGGRHQFSHRKQILIQYGLVLNHEFCVEFNVRRNLIYQKNFFYISICHKHTASLHILKQYFVLDV